MSKTDYAKVVKQLLALADVKVGGNRPQDIIVHDDRFYQRVLSKGPLGLGESYMDGWWDANHLDKLLCNVLSAHLDERASRAMKAKVVWQSLKGRALNRQAGKQAYKNAQAHYDIGNDLYEPMLGSTMAYTCAYWAWGAKNIDQAQTDKYDLVCKKLGLKKDMKVLDIGCGWGGLAMHMAKKYGCEVTCFTPAKEQIAYIKKHAKGLKVKPVLSTWQDYSTKTKFDRVSAIGVMEHVGPKNYAAFYRKVKKWVADDGLFIMHTIGSNKSLMTLDPWFDRYIFPGAVVPSVKQLASAAEGLYVMEDWHNMGVNYDKTLLAWYHNFKKSYPTLDHKKYDKRFVRMWDYYLLSCAAGFRARSLQLWQVVYSPEGVRGGYKSVR